LFVVEVIHLPQEICLKIAIPSVFPWQSSKFQHSSITSQLAMGGKVCSENYVQVTDRDHDDSTEFQISDTVEFDNVADTVCLGAASDSTEIEWLQA